MLKFNNLESSLLIGHTHCIIRHSKKFPGNERKLQNFDSSVLPYKFGLIFMRMKQKKILEKKNSKWLIFQNGRFSKLPILKIFSRKFYRLVLGLVGLIDAKDIDVAQPIWS